METKKEGKKDGIYGGREKEREENIQAKNLMVS